MSLIVLKIGGSVITEKGSVSVAKKDAIDRIIWPLHQKKFTLLLLQLFYLS